MATPRHVRSFTALVALSLASLAGCDCSGTTPSGQCTSSADCTGSATCVDGTCVPLGDGGPVARDAYVPTADDAGQDGGPACPSAVLCGSPAACCDVGDECVEGACLPACASSVRCGADLTTCCDAGEVCISGACESPRAECTDSFDCEDGEFCEPTLGRCLPQFDPVTCRTEPVYGPFEVTVEWSATSSTTDPTCMQAISAPVVVDLDGDRIPEVVASFACEGDWQRGVLRAYRGDTGVELWTVPSTSYLLNGRASIAAGDLDGDGRAEIVAYGGTATNYVYAFHGDGSHAWTATNTDGSPLAVAGFANGAPTLADLDEDGFPEVVLGATVLDHTGRLLWTSGTGGTEGTNSGYTGGLAIVADLDGDGLPEVVTGRKAFHRDGTAFWTSAATDGYPAVAQFDDDAQPEIALVSSGTVSLLDGLTGVVQWGPVALPGGGRGGPPTIADFDGDGLPEIGVAGAGSYSVYDPDGTTSVLWSQTTQDVSSNATGSSVFDFEGDGVAEVVYDDECYVRVYRGTDGTVQLQIPSSSATIHEYPLVADADGDGNSEIVLVSNDYAAPDCGSGYTGERHGLFVYGDARDQWMRTRRVWNQHAYHVTNVDTNGVIARDEVDNWSVPGLNNYRQNAQGEGVYNAPDLAIVGLEVDLSSCPSAATLRARVANVGSLGVPAGVAVAFYAGTPDARGALLGTGTTTIALLPGASTLVTLSVPLAGDAPYAFTAVADDDGTGVGAVTECDETNDAAGIDGLDCDILG